MTKHWWTWAQVQWWFKLHMVPQELLRHMISQDWLSIIKFPMIPMARPSILFSKSTSVRWNHFLENIRGLWNPSKQVRLGFLIRVASIPIVTILGPWDYSSTIMQVGDWQFWVMKWNGTTTTTKRSGWTRNSMRARYGRGGHPSTHMLRWPWM